MFHPVYKYCIWHKYPQFPPQKTNAIRFRETHLHRADGRAAAARFATAVNDVEEETDHPQATRSTMAPATDAWCFDVEAKVERQGILSNNTLKCVFKEQLLVCFFSPIGSLLFSSIIQKQ